MYTPYLESFTPVFGNLSFSENFDKTAISGVYLFTLRCIWDSCLVRSLESNLRTDHFFYFLFAFICFRPEKKLENCVYKTQVMSPCPKPDFTPYPILTHDPLTHSIYTGDKCLKCKSQNCRNCVKNYIFVCKKSHAHLQYACNICAKLQTECLKTLREVCHTILLPLLKPNLKIV